MTPDQREDPDRSEFTPGDPDRFDGGEDEDGSGGSTYLFIVVITESVVFLAFLIAGVFWILPYFKGAFNQAGGELPALTRLILSMARTAAAFPPLVATPSAIFILLGLVFRNNNAVLTVLNVILVVLVVTAVVLGVVGLYLPLLNVVGGAP